MRLMFNVGDTVPSLWIDGPLPLAKRRDHNVRLRGQPKSATPIPEFSVKGDLLCGERESPPQHRITLKLRYQKSTTPPSTTPPSEGKWTEVPNSPVYDQIHVQLTQEAVAAIREIDDPECSFELTLDDVELVRS